MHVIYFLVTSFKMLQLLWSNLSHIKKAQLTPTNVRLKLFSTITEKFFVSVKFNNLLPIIFNRGQRFGKKGKLQPVG